MGFSTSTPYFYSLSNLSLRALLLSFSFSCFFSLPSFTFFSLKSSIGTGFIDYPYVKTAFYNLLSYKLSMAIKIVPKVKFLLAFLLLLASTYCYKLFLSISLSFVVLK